MFNIKIRSDKHTLSRLWLFDTLAVVSYFISPVNIFIYRSRVILSMKDNAICYQKVQSPRATK